MIVVMKTNCSHHRSTSSARKCCRGRSVASCWSTLPRKRLQSGVKGILMPVASDINDKLCLAHAVPWKRTIMGSSMAIITAASWACCKRRRAVCGSQVVEDVCSKAHGARTDMPSAFPEPLATSGAPARSPGGARAQASRGTLADSGKKIPYMTIFRHVGKIAHRFGVCVTKRIMSGWEGGIYWLLISGNDTRFFIYAITLHRRR